MLWTKKKRRSATEDEFYERIEKLRKQFAVGATFDNVVVDFEIGEDWQQLQDNCHGLVKFRCFTSNAHESIEGVERRIKAAHNFWTKGSFINGHFHADCDEWLYLVEGTMEVLTIENGEEKEKCYTSDSPQPIIIKRGVKHFVRALTDVSFVVKFVF